MDNGTNWQSQFSQGFATSQPVDTSAIWIFLLVLAVALAVFYLIQRFGKSNSSGPQRKSTTSHPAEKRPPTSVDEDFVAPTPKETFRAPTGKLNPLQKKILREMIDEFRLHETSAQAVPVAILEKFSEFFFENVKKLKTNDGEVRDFVDRNFPLKDGYSVELDFQSSGISHLIKSKVIEVSAKTVTVSYDGQALGFMKRGHPVDVNYNVGKHFVQGSSTIVDVRPRMGIVVKKPARVALTSERRFSRVNLKNVFGNLSDPRRGYKTGVRVMDLSLEGVRIQVEKPLEKKNIHQLTFEVSLDGRPTPFGPIECVPSKAFLTGTGTYEAGLVFLYLDMGTRARLTAYMKQLAQELQDARRDRA